MAEREVETVERKDEIVSGKTFLGIEFGSTRIKAVLTDANHTPIASGSHEWENRLDHGIWTYTMDDIWCGVRRQQESMPLRLYKYPVPESRSSLRSEASALVFLSSCTLHR